MRKRKDRSGKMAGFGCAILLGLSLTACSTGDKQEKEDEIFSWKDPEKTTEKAAVPAPAAKPQNPSPAAVAETPKKDLAEMSIEELKAELKKREQARQQQAALDRSNSDLGKQLERKINKEKAARPSEKKDFWSTRNSKVKREKYGDVSKPMESVDSIYPWRGEFGRSSTLKDQSVIP